MRSRYRVTPETNTYFITTSTHLWGPILFNETLFQIILDSLSRSIFQAPNGQQSAFWPLDCCPARAKLDPLSLKYCQANKGLRLHGYVIMTNHVHAIISHEEYDQIPNIVRDIKRHTGQEIKNYLSNLGKFSQLFWVKIFHNKERGQNKIWQEGYHPVAIKSEAFFDEKLDYIHYNPVKKGFVEKPEHWKYSSARNYLLGDDSLIVIDEIEWSEVCRLKSV